MLTVVAPQSGPQTALLELDASHSAAQSSMVCNAAVANHDDTGLARISCALTPAVAMIGGTSAWGPASGAAAKLVPGAAVCPPAELSTG
jgi:hypothetical protein